MELEFTAFEADGKQFKFKLNDSEINYLSIREHIPESLCIEAIERIKKESGKKCAMIFGNCQTASIRRFLLRHFEFRKKFFFLNVPAVCNYRDNTRDLIFGGGGQFLQLVDLFISQHVKQKNNFGVQLATKNISSKLSESCKILWFPNSYFAGHQPQRVEQIHKVGTTPNNKMGKFPYGDCYLDEIMKKSEMNPDVEAILDKICHPDFISREKLQDKANNSLTELKKREWFCEIKISDYIEQNMFGKRLFYSMNHPTPQILVEVSKRILRTLGMHSDNFLEYESLVDSRNLTFSLIGMDTPIYPSAIKFFEIEEEPDIYWANRWLWDFKGNFRDYQRAYIRQCWAEKFTK